MVTAALRIILPRAITFFKFLFSLLDMSKLQELNQGSWNVYRLHYSWIITNWETKPFFPKKYHRTVGLPNASFYNWLIHFKLR